MIKTPAPNRARLYDLVLPRDARTIVSAQLGAEPIPDGRPNVTAHHVPWSLDSPVGADSRCRPPVTDGSADGVILHGVLDRRPVAPDRLNARLVVLHAAHRALRPRGVVAAAVANRLAVSGAAAPDSGSSTGGWRFAPMTYWGYAALFRRAGFGRLAAWAVLPGYEQPQRIVSTAWPAARHFYGSLACGDRERGFATRTILTILGALNLRPHLEPAFLLVAERC